MEYLVKRARYIKDYVLEFTFQDGTVKEIDLQPFLSGPIFESLRDSKKFRKFRISGGTIAWGKDADIAPETLYYGLGPAQTEKSSRVPATS